MLAERADEVGGQSLTLVDISADLADEALFLFLDRLRLRLDVLEVVAVGDRLFVREYASVGDFGDEYRVRAVVVHTDDLAGEIRVRVLGQVYKPVRAALNIASVLELVRVASADKAEVLEGLERYALGQHRYVELAGILDHVVRQVSLVDRDSDTFRCVGKQLRGVDYAAVVLAALVRRQDEQTV